MSKKILVFSPHPDDEVLGCGGTLAKLKKEGCIIRVILVTKGELFSPAGKSANYRLDEFKNALKILEINDFIFLNYNDGKIPVSGKILNDYLKFYNEFLPDTIFLPSLSDNHIDHINVTRGVIKALENNLRLNVTLSFYEIVKPVNVNLINDISDYFDIKLKAFQCYQSQQNQYNYLQTLKALAQLRGAAIGSNAGEGFFQFEWDGSPENFFVESPLISVIVRSHKKYLLLNALDSLLNQNYHLFEVLIVWFGENNLQVPEKYNQLDFKILKGKKNRSYNLNLGIKFSRGDFITFLDEDDILYPYHIAELSEILVANKEIDVVYSGANVTKCRLDKKQVKKIADISSFNSDYEKGKLFFENYVSLNTIMVRKNVFKNIIFPEEFEAYEDWIFLFNLEKSGFTFFHLDKITCEYRIFGDDYRLAHIKKGYAEIEDRVREYIFKNLEFSDYKNIVNFYSDMKKQKNILINIFIMFCFSFFQIPYKLFKKYILPILFCKASYLICNISCTKSNN